MTADNAPVEIFGVGPDGELVPIASQAARSWVVQGETRTASGGNIGLETSDGDNKFGADYRARAGQRPGGYGDRPTRDGGREDVVAPVPVLPGVASRALNSGAIFSKPIPGVNVDVGSLEVDARGSSWRVSVCCGRFGRQRRATLRAYPSPSLNLTILELVPTRSTVVHSRAFINAGVPIVEILIRRLSDVRFRSAGTAVMR